MKRVLVWYGGRSPAIERLSARLIHHLRQIRPQLAIAMLANDANPHLPGLESDRIRVFRTKAPSGLSAPGQVLMSGPRHARMLLQALSEMRPDVVLITMNFALAWPLVMLCRLKSVPVILLVHDPEPHAGDYAPLWQQLSQTWLIRQTSGVVALSSWSAQRLLDCGRPVSVWPINLFSPPTRRALPNPRSGGAVRFLFLGRMIAYKGLEQLHAACLQLKSEPGWSLTLAGDGPIGLWAKEAFADMPQVRLDAIRTLSEAEIDFMFATHDVVVCPYTDATQSAVVSEALYAGRPVIVTAVAGLPEQVRTGYSGLVLPAGNAAELANAMLRLITEAGLLEALAEGAAETVDPRVIEHDWHRHIAELEATLGA